MAKTAIIWFRQDLRIKDNPALAAAADYDTIYPIYILDDENAGPAQMGAASRYWLHESLQKLNESLNGTLNLFKGPADSILTGLVKEIDAEALLWNRCYEPWRIARDKK